MKRRLVATLLVGSGLVWGASAPVPMFAQEERARPSGNGGGRNRDEGLGDPSERIDKALMDYQERTGQELEHTRKEVDRLRKEFSELIQTRLDMAIALAELRADAMSEGLSVPPGPQGTFPGMSGYMPGQGGTQGAPTSDAERKHRRASVLNQEFRQFQDSLRNEVQQTRGQTDQLVAQVRALRAQQRQRLEQARSDREREQHKDQPKPGAPKDEQPKK